MVPLNSLIIDRIHLKLEVYPKAACCSRHGRGTARPTIDGTVSPRPLDLRPAHPAQSGIRTIWRSAKVPQDKARPPVWHPRDSEWNGRMLWPRRPPSGVDGPPRRDPSRSMWPGAVGPLFRRTEIGGRQAAGIDTRQQEARGLAGAGEGGGTEGLRRGGVHPRRSERRRTAARCSAGRSWRWSGFGPRRTGSPG